MIQQISEPALVLNDSLHRFLDALLRIEVGMHPDSVFHSSSYPCDLLNASVDKFHSHGVP